MLTPDHSIWFPGPGVNKLAVHAIERSRRSSSDFQRHAQTSTAIVLDTWRDERQFVRVPPDVPRKHFLVSLESTTRQHHIWCKEIMQQTIIFADLQSTDRSSVVGHETNGFRLPMDVNVVVSIDVLEDLVDDRNSASFREDEMLVLTVVSDVFYQFAV